MSLEVSKTVQNPKRPVYVSQSERNRSPSPTPSHLDRKQGVAHMHTRALTFATPPPAAVGDQPRPGYPEQLAAGLFDQTQ